MRKKFLTVLGILFLFIVLSGCGKKDNAQVTDTSKTWYIFQDQGESDVISIKFLKNNKAKVKDTLSLGDSVGIDRKNDNNSNPSYTLDRDGKTITINSSNQVVFKLLKPYKENVYGRHMKGYYVQYQGQTYKFGYITKTDKKVATNKSKSQNIAYKSMSNHIVNVNSDATPLKDSNLAGNFNFSTIINYRRTDGNLTVNTNGTYQMTMTEHAAQPSTETTDSKVVIATTVESGQVQSMYGKVYLIPKNFLSISYYFHGQNQDRLLPKSVNLKVNSKAVGNQIDRAKTRIENDNGQVYLFSSDFTVRKQENQTNTSGNLLTTSSTPQTSLKNDITQTYNYYRNYKANPVSSNADFMQLAAAISDNNDKKLGSVAVNFGGKFGIDQVPSDYTGVDVDGKNQPLMQYLFLVTPAAYKENGPTIATNQGKFLIYGMLNNRLFILRQPDTDSATVTWTLVKGVSLKVPELKFTLN
ncbi:hypothetical protein M5C72_01960 [Companilactobacillus allii]|uniref:Lipoprotein n=1 Tax=Companilactobacillus allii TaxID=1847728 RepID=A0A1P8Q2B6_9LACO|nr:hypothetical protein [Companilactobacillus allii]APX71929.1 hypothetical protein BTM29_04880 [Companilactobacillus allii]USQ69023.1 hypothetical protein M5C72_01960 [Companilactobacillus allii]